MLGVVAEQLEAGGLHNLQLPPLAAPLRQTRLLRDQAPRHLAPPRKQMRVPNVPERGKGQRD